MKKVRLILLSVSAAVLLGMPAGAENSSGALPTSTEGGQTASVSFRTGDERPPTVLWLTLGVVGLAAFTAALSLMVSDRKKEKDETKAILDSLRRKE